MSVAEGRLLTPRQDGDVGDLQTPAVRLGPLMSTTRRFGRGSTTSGLPRSTDILGVRRYVSKVPIAEVMPSYVVSICYRRRRRFTCRVINSKGPCRHGAEPKRSVRKSRKTLTLGSRCRPGGNRAHNGKSPGSCASCNTGSRSPFWIAGATTGSPWRMIPAPAMASFNNMSALSALTGPFTLTGTNSPSIRNCQIDAPGTWLIVRHECRARSEGRIGRPWEAR